MAEDKKYSSDRFRMRSAVTFESDASDADEPIRLDLGIDPSRNFERINDTEGAAAGPSSIEVHRREDNPFSFKHFLRSSTTNYQSQGARPKVYCDGRPIASISDLELDSPGIKQTRIVSEFSSALPDFVQDHLVVEQCYLDKENSENGFNIGAGNLPDFTPHRTNINYSRLNGEPSHAGRCTDNNEASNLALPLDLPVRSLGFPLDLPIAENNCVGSRSCPTSSEVGSSKSLPDFLTDGAVRTQNDENLPGSSTESELDTLRHNVELYRQQLTEQISCTEQLRRQLDAARKKEVEYTHNLTKALEQVEENLERSNQRAAAAEDTIMKLKQELKSARSRTKLLQQENDRLKREQGASGGPSTSRDDTQSRQVAQELRISANSAEQSLRQLLLGVENLRMIASALENVNRIEEKDSISSDLEDNTGPAL